MLAMLLNFLGGGVLKSVLAHLEAQANNETERERIRTTVTIEQIKAELATRQAQRDVLVREADSKFLSLPRWLFGITAWFYFAAVVVDHVFDLPGVVIALPSDAAAIVSIIVGGLFLHATFGK